MMQLGYKKQKSNQILSISIEAQNL